MSPDENTTTTVFQCLLPQKPSQPLLKSQKFLILHFSKEQSFHEQAALHCYLFLPPVLRATDWQQVHTLAARESRDCRGVLFGLLFKKILSTGMILSFLTKKKILSVGEILSFLTQSQNDKRSQSPLHTQINR